MDGTADLSNNLILVVRQGLATFSGLGLCRQNLRTATASREGTRGTGHGSCEIGVWQAVSKRDGAIRARTGPGDNRGPVSAGILVPPICAVPG